MDAVKGANWKVDAMNTTKGQFVGCCEECNGGWLEYQCPACDKYERSYDAWESNLDDHRIVDDLPVVFECESCKALLQATRNGEAPNEHIVSERVAR